MADGGPLDAPVTLMLLVSAPQHRACPDLNAGSGSRTSPYHPVHLPDLRCPVQREHVQWLITCKHTARRMGCWWPHLQHDAGQRLGNQGGGGKGMPNEGLGGTKVTSLQRRSTEAGEGSTGNYSTMAAEGVMGPGRKRRVVLWGREDRELSLHPAPI